jgi:xylan 1,4-beta-xylosidase
MLISRRRIMAAAGSILAMTGERAMGQKAKRPSGVRGDAPVETGPLPALPPIRPLFDYPMRDVSICLGPDGVYYLTGTTGYPDWWAVTGDIQVWKSPDLKSWTPVADQPRRRAIVWNLDRDGTWGKRVPIRDGAPFRPLWAPEIHYLKDTFWITYSIPLGGGGGLLKSVSGRAEGPYHAVWPKRPLVNEIDLCLFEESDGKVYLVWGAGKIRQLNDDLTNFVGEQTVLRPADADVIGFEGTFVFKANGKYHITGAEFVEDPKGGQGNDYHCYAAVGDSLLGPYGKKYLAIPHAGHNSFFRDKDSNWWATFFGNDPRAPVFERPAILRIEFGADGRIHPAMPKA